jgi:hypothetical protein
MCVFSRDWPTHGGMVGNVREWNGLVYGADRVPRPVSDMRVYECMCVCMNAYVCMNCVNLTEGFDAYTHACMYIYVCISLSRSVSDMRVYECMCVCMMYIRVHVYIFMCE